MNTPSLRTCIAALLLALAAGAAQAATLPAASWAVITPEADGDFSITYKRRETELNVSPATYLEAIWFYNANPGNQDPQRIGELVAQKYSVSAANMVYVGGCESSSACSAGEDNSLLNSYADAYGNFHVELDPGLPQLKGFDYLALHIGGGELFFHWAQPITSFTLTGEGKWSASSISNYRAYFATPLPGAFALFLGALGMLGARRWLPRGRPA